MHGKSFVIKMYVQQLLNIQYIAKKNLSSQVLSYKNKENTQIYQKTHNKKVIGSKNI